MLSADVPEFIPKALRAQGQAATQTNAEEDGHSTPTADALQTKPDLSDESPTSKESSTDNASDVKTVEQPHLSGNEGLGKESLPSQTGMVVPTLPITELNIPQTQSIIPVLGVDQDAGISVGLEDLAAAPAAVASGLMTQCDEGSPVVASSLRATSAEFYPAGMFIGYNSPTDSPGPQMSYTGSPSPHNSSGFMYANKPPFYYEPNGYNYYCNSNWVHDLDYSQGFYNPMVNAGHYSAGEYFVPNGGYMYEGGDGGYPQQPPSGAGLIVDPPYFDPNLATEYSGGFVDVPGPGAVGRGGGAAGGPPAGYNKKNPNKNRQKRPPDHGGGRGTAVVGGSRQPSNEMRICGQTGELTVGKKRPQGTTPQGGRGSAPQRDKVQASTIISNVKNWPTLNTGKVEKEKNNIAPLASVGTQVVVAANVPDHAAVSTAVKPPVAERVQAPPTISFSSIAKKKSEIAEPALVSSKQSNPGPSAVEAKKKHLRPTITSDDTRKMKEAQYTPVSGIEIDPSKTSSNNEFSVTKSDTDWIFKGKQTSFVKAIPSSVMENAVQKEDTSQPNSFVNSTPLTKSAKKKAKKKNKKQLTATAVAGIMEESAVESNGITVIASPIENGKSGDVVYAAIVDEEPSDLVAPEQSKAVSECQVQWPSKEVSTNKYSTNLEASQPITETQNDEKSDCEDIEIEVITSNISSPVNSTVKQTNVSGKITVDSKSTESKKPETIPEESIWFTVGKRTKSKKELVPIKPDVSLSQNGKSYKGNSNQNMLSATQRSTKLARTNIAIKEITLKDGSSGSPSAKPKVVVSAQKDGFSSSPSTKPKVVASASKDGFSSSPSTKPKVVASAPRDGSSSIPITRPKIVVSAPNDGFSNSPSTKPEVVYKTETSAQISSLEGDPTKELDELEFSESVVTSTSVEIKKRDPNDPEVQKIMKQREIRKENIKREKKLNREAAALEKKAMAKKDSKISVMPAVSSRSAVTQAAATKSFAIKSEEYPTLGARKAPKSHLDESAKSSKKEAVKKINGIIQKNSELGGTNVAKTKSQDELDTVVSSSVWASGCKNMSATNTSSQHSVKINNTTLVPSPAPAEESSSVKRKILSYSLAAASLPAATSRASKTRSDTTAPAAAATATGVVNKGTVAVKAKKNVQPPARSKHVKSSDKLEIDLWNLLAIKPSKSKQASSSVSQVVSSRTARRSTVVRPTTVARPARVLTTSMGKPPRIKGQKRKVPTAIQRYKRLHAQHTQDLLLLLADLKRRQDADQITDINTEGFREENRDCSQTSSSDHSNSTNNTCVPDVSTSNTLLSNHNSDSGHADTSNSANDASKSSKKKRKRNKKSSATEASSSTAALDSSTKSSLGVAVARDVPKGAMASAAAADKQQGGEAPSAVAHKPLSPTEAKAIADRLAEELQKLQETKKIVKTNVITRELNDYLSALLQAIVRFQRRSYFHDQIKAKAKRRFVSGIKEVHQKLHKIQLLIVAQDVCSKIPMVADSVAALLKDAEAQHVPVVFGLNRSRLGRLTRKEAGFYISCVGILNYQGAEDSVKGIMSILPELQRQQQLINDLKQEATTTSSILEEEEVEEDSPALACDGNSLPSPTVATSSSSSNQSTPAKVSAASAINSAPETMRGKNGIRQMAGSAGKLGGAAAGMVTATATTANARLDVNDKIVNILKGQKDHVSNKNQTS